MDKQHFDPQAGHDRSAELLEQVRQALAEKTALAIRGGSSKAFLGRWVEARPLDVAGHTGIVSYDPTELVITARAGTPLRELNAALDSAGQMLACEAPCFTENATVGGMLAAGLSGPRRPWAGAVRDFVLGTRLISGLGTHLRFGGEVMKNVAGYDLSRLLAGSFGCLGVITEASFKVLPKPRCRISLRQAIPLERALRGERVIPGVEMQYTDQQGKKSWHLVHAVPVYDGTGKLNGGFVALSDVTDRNAMKELLRHAPKLNALAELSSGLAAADAERSLARLTRREAEVLRSIVAGRSNKEIARELQLSPRTVENHRASIMKRTGSKSLPALARLALAAASHSERQPSRV